jgi:hypothetical protein
MPEEVPHQQVFKVRSFGDVVNIIVVEKRYGGYFMGPYV